MRVNALSPTRGAARRMVSACLISAGLLIGNGFSTPELLQRCSPARLQGCNAATLQTYNPTTLQHDTGDTHAAWDMKAIATTPR